VVYLREDLGFVCESGLDARAGWEAGGGRWMHELGVAFARLDPKGRTPPSWNRLQPLAAPSQPFAATHSHLQPPTAPHALSLLLRPRVPVERQPAAAEHGSA